MRRTSILSGCWRRKKGFQGLARRSWRGDQTGLRFKYPELASGRDSISDNRHITNRHMHEHDLNRSRWWYALCLNILRKHLHVTPSIPLFLNYSVLGSLLDLSASAFGVTTRQWYTPNTGDYHTR
jgi:hypothetical protein